MKPALTAIGILAGLALLTPPAQAQTSGARGKIVDQEGNPVSGATVRIESLRKPQKYEVRTNDKGEYLQLGMEPGPHRVTASKEGFLEGSGDVGIQVGITDLPALQLLPAPPPQLTQEELQAMFTRGVKLTQDGQLDEAEAAYREILELQPALAEALGNLGYVYTKKEEWESAEKTYLEAIELRPDEPRFLMALAQMYRNAGREEKADELIERVLSQTPADAAGHINRGVLLLNSGRNEEAQKAFEDALAMDPSAAEAHYFLGTIMVGQGKVPEAIEHLEAYLATNPENTQYVTTAEGLLEALKK